MDDDLIGAALKDEGAKTATTSGDVARMLASIERRARRRVVERALVAGAVVVALAVGIASVASLHRGAPVTRGTVEIHVYPPRYGFGWELPFTATYDGTITGGRWEFGTQSGRAPGYDDSVQSDIGTYRVTGVSSGDHVVMEGQFFPACDGADTVPTLVLTWALAAGGTRVERITPSNVEAFETAVAAWCRLPVQATVAGWSTSANGTVHTIRLQLANPSTKPVDIVVRDVVVAVDHAHWHGARLTLGPRSAHELKIRVTSTNDLRLVGLSRPSDLVTADGTPIDIPRR